MNLPEFLNTFSTNQMKKPRHDVFRGNHDTKNWSHLCWVHSLIVCGLGSMIASASHDFRCILVVFLDNFLVESVINKFFCGNFHHLVMIFAAGVISYDMRFVMG